MVSIQIAPLTSSYWIVVSRGNIELLRALSMAFRGQTGFQVIVDRRVFERGPATHERRDHLQWGADEFIVAERVESLV